jgi:hypothetical protein
VRTAATAAEEAASAATAVALATGGPAVSALVLAEPHDPVVARVLAVIRDRVVVSGSATTGGVTVGTTGEWVARVTSAATAG